MPFDSSPLRRLSGSVLLLILCIRPNARAADVSIQVGGSARDLAFARYIAAHGQRDPFATSEPVGVFIEASLPELYKSAALLAVRRQGENDGGQLDVLQIAGDGTVVEEVLERYFALRQPFDAQPFSSIAITPDNYKFRFAGEVKTGGGAAYVYDIAPKKNRRGLVVGQLWMDSETGREVVLSGHSTGISTAGGRFDVVRDTTLMNGSAFARVTHVSFAVPLLGRAEVVITEIVATPEVTAQPY